jgi:hypothetical protein
MSHRPWLLMLLLLPLAAQAGEEIQKAQLLSMQMKYVEALKLAEGVLRTAGASPEDVRGAYDIVAQCQASLGKDKAAVDAFQRLLALDPAYRLSPAVSPKIQAPFQKALKAAEGLGQVKVSHKPPAAPAKLAGVELTVQLEVNPLELVQGLRLVYSAPGGAPQEVVRPVKGAGPVVFKMAASLDLAELHYHVEAVNADKATLLSLGSRSEPFKLKAEPQAVAAADGAGAPSLVRKPTGEDPVAGDPTAPPEDEDRPAEAGAWYTTWWFWTVVGAVVVGGAAAGLAVGLSGGEEGGLRYDLVIR